ncbi:MAG: hypothetical protein E6Q76_14475 [Rhizobium sp.]|nr:MAG: hypothetical protein E6Q76_14475 [Rhizobium sp.]
MTIWDPNSMEVAGYKPPVKRPAPPAPEQDAKKESTDGGRGGRRHRNRADEPEEYESYLAWFAERILWAKPGLKPATEAVANVLFDDRDLDVLDDIIAEHPRIALPPSCL